MRTPEEQSSAAGFHTLAGGAVTKLRRTSLPANAVLSQPYSCGVSQI